MPYLRGCLSLVLLTVLARCTTVVTAQDDDATCDMCFFTSDDASDCRVYGKIDGNLTSWTKASEDCLDAYTIKNTGVDPLSVGCGDPPNANTFVNFGIRQGIIPNSVLPGLGVAAGGFFEQGSGRAYVLKDSITVNGETIDCEASESDCYAAMRTYFAIGGAGAQELQDVCDTILANVANDRELEQSAARNRICQDIQGGTTPPTGCGDLVSEVQKAMDEYPEKQACSSFAFGPDNDVSQHCGFIRCRSLCSNLNRTLLIAGRTWLRRRQHH